MTRSALLIAATALLAAACAPMQWVKTDGAPAQLDQDASECQQKAWREARLHAWSQVPIGPSVLQDAAGRRIVIWPASPFNDPFNDTYMEESRVAHACMRARGYELVPMAKKP
jgi:hypothetical protein